MGSASIDARAGSSRFPVLDGLRGVAALAVLLLHLPPLAGLVSHGYLAVDLFFMMSGFVVAHAYEDRLLRGWSLGGFIRTRVIRLWPLYLLGTAIGAVVFASVAGDAGGFAALGVLVAAAVFLIPLPLSPKVQVFDLNRPAWSLFFEMVANIAYAALAPRLSNRVLAGLVAAGAVAVAISFLMAGTGSLGHHGDSLAGGAARILFAFPLGVLLLRLHRAGRLGLRLPTPVILIATVGAFALPDVKALNGLIDLTVVLLVLPVLTIAAITAPASGRAARGFAFLAVLSYPLYILHGPILMAVGQWWGEGTVPVVCGGALSLLVAWAAARWFDAPARAALGAFLARRRPATATAA